MTRANARQQCGRLKCLNYFPAESTAIKELVSVIQEVCTDLDHARLVIDAIIESTSECPTPADIRRVAHQRRQDQVSARQRCELCHGTGFTFDWWLVTPRSGRPNSRERLTDDQVAKLRERGVGYVVGGQCLVEAVEPCRCRGEA